MNILLTLLHDEYGVCETALLWFRTFLEDRTHSVHVDSKTSVIIPLQSGVPQGSVLGPVMFTLYTIPMQRVFKRHGIKYHKYADDIQLYASLNQATRWKLRGDSHTVLGKSGDGWRCGESLRSIIQLSVVVFFVFFFLADFPLSMEAEVEQRGPW